jgi:ATP-dependent exoDNAse (exonuclease V) alpha subunit
MPPSFTPTPQQQTALDKLNQFIESDDEIFILKGHAGTGKTTLIKHFVDRLTEQDIPYELMASTGRAAKVLGYKTGITVTTVHQCIYRLHLAEDDEANQVRRLQFRLGSNEDPENAVYIIDESSMLSNRQVEGGFISFGTGRLITDLLTYAGQRKVIFVGDPAQLPPVNSHFSAALSQDYLTQNFNKKVQTSILTEIIRYRGDTGIFYNTLELRKKIEQGSFPYLSIRARGFEDVFITPYERIFLGAYVETVKAKGLDNSTVVCFTNAKANDLNIKIRHLLFGQKKSQTLNEGELLMVIQNNYKYQLFNGDHLQIESFSSTTEYHAGLHFRDVTVYVDDYNGRRLVHVKIIDDLLTLSSVNLSYQKEFQLFQDFAIRMSKMGIRPKNPEYLTYLINDSWLNALRVKYGYAVTCHKAQGGEWRDVFVMFEPCFFTNMDKESQHRWAYTAISRAEKRLHLLENRCIY